MTSSTGKIITEVGFTALLGTATALTSTSANVYTLIYNIVKYSGPNKVNIITSINKLDIENTLKITELMLREIPKEKIRSNSVMQGVESIYEIIKKIEQELRSIYTKLKYNEKLWILNYWKAYDCSTHLQKLQTYNEILEKRKKLLYEILQIKNDIFIMNNISKLESNNYETFFVNSKPEIKVLSNNKDDDDKSQSLVIKENL